MKPTTELPDDPALPGLLAIRRLGLARAVPSLGFDGGPETIRMVGYTPGSRATLEVRVATRRVAVKAYAEDPAPEAELYVALAGSRVPPLLGWERDLRILVIGWLEGPTAHDLVRGGQGERAGELAARWLECARALSVNVGPPVGSAQLVDRADGWVAELGAADATLGAAARALSEGLAQTPPPEGEPRLVHGTLYDRHVLDLGDGPGVIDWQRFGQGPIEMDAATFLATVSRTRLAQPDAAAAAVRAEATFLAHTRGWWDERALAWHRAAALLRAARRQLNRRKGDWRVRVDALLAEGARLARAA
jgi:hypothetical protein